MDDRSGKARMITDSEVNVTVSTPSVLARGFQTYERYEVSLPRGDEAALRQTRDVIRAGRAVAVLPIDLANDSLVMIRQFRLPAHLATGRGNLVEIPAGRVDHGEAPLDAARRECREEIGVAPERLHELYSVLATPGFTDEYVTFYLGFLDSGAVASRGGLADEHEDTRPFVVPIADALAALEGNHVSNALMYSALQWLALNRGRLRDYFNRAA